MSTKTTFFNDKHLQPSNSGRSAELLGTSVQSFVGFASTLDGGFLSVLPGFQSNEVSPEEIDSNVDYNYQLVFRKMTKKDPTTKVKALQEFTELVGQSDVDAVRGMSFLTQKIIPTFKSTPPMINKLLQPFCRSGRDCTEI